MKTASDHYDLESASDQLIREAHYCEMHDTFKVKDSMGDFVCPACRALAGIEYALNQNL